MFLKLSMGYVVLELCLVYNIDIVFLKVSIKILKCLFFVVVFPSICSMIGENQENWDNRRCCLDFILIKGGETSS